MSVWQFNFIPFGFSRNDISRETVKPCYLWLFPKIWRSFPSILAIFVIFGGVIDISLLQKKLLTSAYNRWYHHIFSFNILEIACLIITFTSVLNYFFLKNDETGNREWMNWNCCSLISLKWVAFSTDCSYDKSNN